MQVLFTRAATQNLVPKVSFLPVPWSEIWDGRRKLRERGWSCACGLVDNLRIRPSVSSSHTFSHSLKIWPRFSATKQRFSHKNINFPCIPLIFVRKCLGVLFCSQKNAKILLKNPAQKVYSLQPTLRLEPSFVFLSDEKKGRLSLNHVKPLKSPKPELLLLGYSQRIKTELAVGSARPFIGLGQGPITWRGQLPCALVTAFSLTSLFLERFWREFWISFKFLKPVSKTYRPKNDIFCFLITFNFPFWYLILRIR